jgi:hypothetical protein
VATNTLGLQLNLQRLEDHGKFSGVTLGAFRRGRGVSWTPGATIDIWTRCGRMESVTGVPWPHAMFIQTIGEAGTYQGIFCPQCRLEVAELRARGLLSHSTTSPPKPQKPQLSLF